MTRHRVDTADEFPLNHVEDVPDSSAMVHRSSNSLSSTHSSKLRRINMEEQQEEEEEGDKVKDLLVYYARNSTMHGIPSIVGSKLYRGRHVFWMGIVGMMALFLGYVIFTQMNDYYGYPTVTSVDIHYVTEQDFPALTICDPNIINGRIAKMTRLSNFTIFQLARLTELEGLYHTYAEKLLQKEKNPPTADNTTDTVADMERFLFFTSKILGSPKANPLYCSWGTYYWEKCPAYGVRITSLGVCVTVDVRKLMKRVNETSSAVLNSTEEDKRRSRSVGNFMRGITFYLDTQTAPADYRIFTNKGFKVVLHDADTEPLPLSNSINIQGNAGVEIDVSKVVKVGLPAPYKAFGTATCISTDPEHFENPLRRFKNYTKELCEKECFIDFVVEHCGGCRHFLHPGNESMCALDHLAECFREAQKLYYGGSDGDKMCHCPLPCRQVSFKSAVTTMEFTETDYMRELRRRANMNNTGSFYVSYVHIYYSDPIVTTRRQVAIYSTQGLLGSIGGQIGLFMGFSLVTVAEMLELLFLLSTRGRKLDEHVKRHKDAEAAATAAAHSA